MKNVKDFLYNYYSHGEKIYFTELLFSFILESVGDKFPNNEYSYISLEEFEIIFSCCKAVESVILDIFTGSNFLFQVNSAMKNCKNPWLQGPGGARVRFGAQNGPNPLSFVNKNKQNENKRKNKSLAKEIFWCFLT